MWEIQSNWFHSLGPFHLLWVSPLRIKVIVVRKKASLLHRINCEKFSLSTNMVCSFCYISLSNLVFKKIIVVQKILSNLSLVKWTNILDLKISNINNLQAFKSLRILSLGRNIIKSLQVRMITSAKKDSIIMASSIERASKARRKLWNSFGFLTIKSIVWNLYAACKN